MTKRTAMFALVVPFLSAFVTSASAFHPLISEDTGFLGKNVRQVELGFEHAVSKEGQDVFSNALGCELSYGFNDATDLLLSAPWLGWSTLGSSESGLGDVALEAKTRVAEMAGWTFALKPGFSLPAGDEKKGLGAGKPGMWLHGVAGRVDGPRQFYLNAGGIYNNNSVDEDKLILKFSAAGVLEVMPKVLVSADLAAETNPDKASSNPPLSSVLGLVYSPLPSLDLDAGFKFGLNGPADDFGLLLGLTTRF